MTDIKLDIGCGLKKKEGFVGIDISADVGADYVVDVTSEPLPFEDSSVSEIHCGHLVEHLDDIISFMNECYRVLTPSGKFTILAPYYTAIQATQDPTHVRFINENTFLYYTDRYLKDNRTFDYGIKCRYVIESISYGYINAWGKSWMPKKLQTWARHHLYNVAADITVTLTAVK